LKIEYDTLLNLIPRETDRERLSDLGKQLFETEQARETADPATRSAADSQRNELLDQLLERIQWHFRAMRRPMPTREEISEMVKEHFDKDK
jgi:hypothetical protein